MKYTLDQLKSRIIWCYREPRSGSTWFSNELCKSLNRNQYFIDRYMNQDIHTFSNHDAKSSMTKMQTRDEYVLSFFKNRKQEDLDVEKILTTHHVYALQGLHNYKDPLVIRISRKNKTEQMLSYFVMRATNIFNISTKKEFENYPKIEPITISQRDIENYITTTKTITRLWQSCSSRFESEVVYYEDLLQGWESKIFPVKLHINNDATNTNKNTLKLPYDKKEVIKNYDEVDAILKDKLGPY